MPLPTDIIAYDDHRSVLDAALTSSKGIKVTFPTHAMAIDFRQRCYRLKYMARRLSTKQYEEGNPLRGRDPWAGLRFSLINTSGEQDTKGTVLIIEKMSAQWARTGVKIEDLDTGSSVDVDFE